MNCFKRLSLKIFMYFFLNYKDSKNSVTVNVENNRFNIKTGFLKGHDDVDIGYTLISPKNNVFKESFIFCHGTGSNRSDYYGLFRKNNSLDEDYVVLLLDYRQFADSGGTFTVENTNKDLLSATNFLKEKFGIKEVNFVGHSLGAAVVSEFLKWTSNSERLHKKVVLISPFLSVMDLLRSLTRFNINFLLFFIEGTIREGFAYEVRDNINFVDKQDLLIIHGKRDDLVGYDHGTTLSESSGCELFSPEDDDHVSVIFNSDVWEKIKSFVEKK